MAVKEIIQNFIYTISFLFCVMAVSICLIKGSEKVKILLDCKSFNNQDLFISQKKNTLLIPALVLALVMFLVSFFKFSITVTFLPMVYASVLFSFMFYMNQNFAATEKKALTASRSQNHPTKVVAEPTNEKAKQRQENFYTSLHDVSLQLVKNV